MAARAEGAPAWRQATELGGVYSAEAELQYGPGVEEPSYTVLADTRYWGTEDRRPDIFPVSGLNNYRDGDSLVQGTPGRARRGLTVSATLKLSCLLTLPAGCWTLVLSGEARTRHR